MRTFSAVTTCNGSGYEQYGRDMIASFDRHWPANVVLHVYVEDFEPDRSSPRVVYHDLLAECPGLVAFKRRHASSPLAHGRTKRKRLKIALDWSKPKVKVRRIDWGLGYRWNAVRFSHKTFAIFHAARTVGTDGLFWLDADIRVFADVPEGFLEAMMPEACLLSYLARPKFSECGFVGYNLRHPAIANFITTYEAMYAKDRVHVHRVGVDLQQLQFRARALAPAETPRLLIVGRLIEKKGTSLALEAVAEVIKDYGAVICDIVGDGKLRETLEQQSKSLGLTHQVVFHGSLCRDHVIKLLHKAHVLLAPSVSSSDGDEEGIPTVLMEAMACGLPVVSTLHSGIPELVDNGVSGFLVPERDVRALRDAVLKLLRSPEQWTAMGSAGRVKVEMDHDIKKQNHALSRATRG